MISKELLAILVCPENRTPLALADAALLAAVNRAIALGSVKNKGGEAVSEPLDAGLLREDRAVLYPVVDRIPILLADAAIPLDQIDVRTTAGRN